ncbi:hypothetical protein [Burkholderia sp. MSMB1498]|uniref:hypothetical protein n=1 Tax=Burkholderia sp. MSMB1498 TaxID=1637842 RepID=UPI001E476B12|nr:hypothetical protein [Burkholderia sp. MSMB1498]
MHRLLRDGFAHCGRGYATRIFSKRMACGCRWGNDGRIGDGDGNGNGNGILLEAGRLERRFESDRRDGRRAARVDGVVWQFRRGVWRRIRWRLIHEFRQFGAWRTPSTEHRAPSTEHRAPSTEHRTPNTEHRTPNTEHRTRRAPGPTRDSPDLPTRTTIGSAPSREDGLLELSEERPPKGGDDRLLDPSDSSIRGGSAAVKRRPFDVDAAPDNRRARRAMPIPVATRIMAERAGAHRRTVIRRSMNARMSSLTGQARVAVDARWLADARAFLQRRCEM